MFDSATATFAANKVMRELGESGSIGKVVTHKPSFIIPAEEDFVPDVTLSDMSIKWFSAEVPTKDEFMSGKVFASKSGVTYEDDCSNYEVFAEVEKSFAVSTGQLIIMVAGELENALGAVPKTGMYYCIPDYSQLSNGSIGAEFTFVWETIHPIDPKYLPMATIDLDAWGITPVALTLMAQGGGYQGVRIDHQKFWNEIKNAKLISLAFTAQEGYEPTNLFATQVNTMSDFGTCYVEAHAVLNGMLCIVSLSTDSMPDNPEVPSGTTITVTVYPLT